MKIGELAKITGTKVETIRYYERAGLLASAARTEGNFRIYETAHVERLTFVRHCRSLDMSLEEIRILLRYKDRSEENCEEVNRLLDAHIGHVSARIQGLQALEEQLRVLRGRCHEGVDAGHCGILHELSQTSTIAMAYEGGHVHGAHGGKI